MSTTAPAAHCPTVLGLAEDPHLPGLLDLLVHETFRDTLSAGRMTIEGSKGQVRNVAIPLLGTHNVGNSLI